MIGLLPVKTVFTRYLEALRDGSNLYALRVSQLALAAGVDLHSLYMDVFQPAMYEIGNMWVADRITIAQEHIATAITRNVMAQIHALATARLTPYRMFMRALNRTIVTTCVSGEFHELGLRMVSDFFELEGWRVYHLGSHMPSDDIVHLVNECQADVLAISVTLNNHVGQAQRLIQKVRASSIGSRIHILAGGQPFNYIPDLHHKIGADLTANNARDALHRVTNLLTQRALPTFGNRYVPEL